MEVVARFIRVSKFQPVTHLCDTMFDLNSGVYLHEVVLVSLNNALKGRYVIQPQNRSEVLSLLTHLTEYN